MPDTFDEVSEAAKTYYAKRLQQSLEKTHRDHFVAIEPVSGDYFLGKTLSEAVGLSRKKYPDRLAHTIRIGHVAAIHFGMQTR